MRRKLAIGSIVLVALPADTRAEPVVWSVFEGGNGNFYEIRQESNRNIEWEAARADAERQTLRGVSGHLVTITSQEEYDFVLALIVSTFADVAIVNRPGELWLGGYQPDPFVPPDEGWAWVTGEPWGFVLWSPNEPNDYRGPGSESYLGIWGWTNNGPLGHWNDEQPPTVDTTGWYIMEFTVGQADCDANGEIDAVDLLNDPAADGNGNGFLDRCEADCNANGIPDEDDIAAGTSPDCNGDVVPDECSGDCNANDIFDACDIAAGTSADCNGDGVPDDCTFTDIPRSDCNSNGRLDECELAAPLHAQAADACEAAESICPDITYTGVTFSATNDGSAECDPKARDVWYRYTPTIDGSLTASTCGTDFDCALSIHTACPGTPANELACNDDFCDRASQVEIPVVAGRTYYIRISGRPRPRTQTFILNLTGPDCVGDCNRNGVLDDCEFPDGVADDCNLNGQTDICEIDCNENGRPDDCDIADGVSTDCDENDIPDSCDIANRVSADCNKNGQIDTCEIFDGTSEDCNGNGVPDDCDVDCNGNGIPDRCEQTNRLPTDCIVEQTVVAWALSYEGETVVMSDRADGSEQRTWGTTRPEVVRLAVDAVTGRLCWTDRHADHSSIRCVGLFDDQMDSFDLMPGQFAESIAVDSIDRLLFWADGSNIHRFDLDTLGANQSELFGFAPGSAIVDLDVDESERKLHWIQSVSEEGESRAFIANLDATDLMVRIGLTRPTGIVAVSSINRLYWTDLTDDAVYVEGVGSPRRRILISELSDPLGIDFDSSRGKLYISMVGRIARANADGTEFEPSIFGIQPGLVSDVAVLPETPFAGDMDLDRDVDLRDFVEWFACFRSGEPPGFRACRLADLDGDGDIDLDDFSRFQGFFTGSR